MSIRARYRQAWPTTLGIHVFQTLLAAFLAVPLIGSVSTPEVSLQPGAADSLAAMHVWASLGNAVWPLLPLIAVALNYPWLSVAWIRAMDQPDGFLGHARYALARYVPAAAISLCMLLSLVVLGWAAAGTLGWLSDARLDERTLDLLRLSALLPFAGLACYALCLQDRAHAAIGCGSDRLLDALRLALRHTHVRHVALRAVLIVGQTLVALAAGLLPRVPFGAGPAAAGAVLVTGQVAALALSSVRAAWLAYVVGWRSPLR